MTMPMARRLRLAPVLLALAALLAACSGSSSGDRPAAVAPAPSPTRISEVLGARATAVSLPVTPQSIAYSVVDLPLEPLPGARAYHGVENGAAWQAEIPDNWNGELVLYAHGYRAHDPTLRVEPPPLREHLVGAGFAWAASSYRENGYSPGTAAEDTLALRDVVARIAGKSPTRVYLYGQSMGGNVVTYSLEQHPDAYAGALAECGAVDGARILDYFVDWTVVAAYLAGETDVAITANPARFAQAQTTAQQFLGSPGHLTLQGERFRSIIINLGGGPRPWAEEGFDLQYPVTMSLLSDALSHPDASVVAGGNAGTLYQSDPSLGLDDADLNARVIRVTANPEVVAAAPGLAPLGGRITRPLLTIHGTGDLFVPISLEQSYRRKVEAARSGDLLVQRAVRRPGHCVFSAAEREQAFDDLVNWVRTGARPSGDDLLGAPLMDAGLRFTQPLMPGDPGTP